MAQETLEEAAMKHSSIMFEHEVCDSNVSFKAGAKWQAERSYSLDEIKTAMKNGYGIKYFSEHTFLENLNNLKKK
jgi:hypothetical protein